jgi:formylglycine-generating enzyme required for sulfatase activity
VSQLRAVFVAWSAAALAMAAVGGSGLTLAWAQSPSGGGGTAGAPSVEPKASLPALQAEVETGRRHLQQIEARVKAEADARRGEIAALDAQQRRLQEEIASRRQAEERLAAEAAAQVAAARRAVQRAEEQLAQARQRDAEAAELQRQAEARRTAQERASAAVSTAEKRVALVVGNADYIRVPLNNPVNDAVDLAAALRRLGFEVIERRNRGSDELKRDLVEFQDKLGPGAVGLFYFAGHGVQAGRGQNYLLPVGVDYRRERDAEVFGLEAGSVLRRMEESGAALSIVILDACRDSPLPAEGRSSASRGLGRMETPSGSLVAFATAPGTTADENRSGRNGLYTQYLLRAIEVPGLRLEDVFQQVRRDVERASNRRQSPEEISKLTSAFFFRPTQPQQRVAGPAETMGAAASQAPVSTASSSAPDPEVDLWELAKRRDNVASYEAYLRAYPQGRFAGTARGALEGLRPAAVATVPVAAPAPAAPVAAATTPPQPVVASAASTTATSTRRPGTVFKDCAICPEMVVVPAGRFLMGSPETEAGRSAGEGPRRWVNVGALAMGRYEVTQGQWRAMMGGSPSINKACSVTQLGSPLHDDCPVENVSWTDAQEFLRRLSAAAGHRYRLPSEAEWEYAARAGSTAAYPWGESFNAGRVNGGTATRPVGWFLANAFGLHDMHGNVMEWVQDVWNDSYSGAPTDGSAWLTGADPSRRVLRGGAWSGSPAALRSAARMGSPADTRNGMTGFRVVRDF